MKSKKIRITALVLAIVMVASTILAGCGGGLVGNLLNRDRNSNGGKVDGPADDGGNIPDDILDADDGITVRPLTADETALADRISGLNEDGFTLPTISLYEENMTPAPRNTSLSWDDSVFYTVDLTRNAPGYFHKDLCTLERAQLWNADTGNRIEYEIYRNPSTNAINKIVAIEYLTDRLDVMEFYYTNEGKANFVFHYYTDNYISSYAQPSRVGERFLFGEDNLLNWRVVTEQGTDNYCIGANESRRLSESWGASTIHTLDSLDVNTGNAFASNEIRMLNAAYNTLNAVSNAQSVIRLDGSAVDANGQPLTNAMVSLYTSDFAGELFNTTTDGEGKYAIYLPVEAYDYNLQIKSNGFKPTNIHGIEVSGEQINVSQSPAYMFARDASEAVMSLFLGDALNFSNSGSGMAPLSNALLLIRSGMNNKTGDVITQLNADASGYANFNLAAGTYTVEVQADGFASMFYNIVANPANATNTYELYATPDLPAGEYRIVLTWGESPRDIDSHMFSTINGSSEHVWYADKNDSFGTFLDVDDMSSYGPETVTIRNYNQNGYYKYCVADYSDLSSHNYSSYALSMSGATVNVYSSAGLVATFQVPANRPGCLWEVFEIRNGQIVPIQRYYENSTNEWWHHA